jgi:hypothetical protein
MDVKLTRTLRRKSSRCALITIARLFTPLWAAGANRLAARQPSAQWKRRGCAFTRMRGSPGRSCRHSYSRLGAPMAGRGRRGHRVSEPTVRKWGPLSAEQGRAITRRPHVIARHAAPAGELVQRLRRRLDGHADHERAGAQRKTRCARAVPLCLERPSAPRRPLGWAALLLITARPRCADVDIRKLAASSVSNISLQVSGVAKRVAALEVVRSTIPRGWQTWRKCWATKVLVSRRSSCSVR